MSNHEADEANSPAISSPNLSAKPSAQRAPLRAPHQVPYQQTRHEAGSSHALFDRARWWLAQGAELVPIRAGTKAVIRGFGAHSRHVATEREAWYWFDKLQVNLGVVCGGLIGLACADFDEAAAFDDWRAGPGKDVHTLIEKTGRGYHVYFTGQGLPTVLTANVEFRASGIMMAAPSLHPSGRLYEVVSGDPIARLTADELAALFPFVSDLLTQPTPTTPTTRPMLTPLPRRETIHKDDVVSRIKTARPVSEEARVLTDLRGREGHFYGRCPFHEDREPSFWVDDEAGLWGCYSPSCPTNMGGQKAHDLINLRALSRDIGMREAIRELAAECLPPLTPARPAHPAHQAHQIMPDTHEERTKDGR